MSFPDTVQHVSGPKHQDGDTLDVLLIMSSEILHEVSVSGFLSDHHACCPCTCSWISGGQTSHAVQMRSGSCALSITSAMMHTHLSKDTVCSAMVWLIHHTAGCSRRPLWLGDAWTPGQKHATLTVTPSPAGEKSQGTRVYISALPRRRAGSAGGGGARPVSLFTEISSQLSACTLLTSSQSQRDSAVCVISLTAGIVRLCYCVSFAGRCLALPRHSSLQELVLVERLNSLSMCKQPDRHTWAHKLPASHRSPSVQADLRLSQYDLQLGAGTHCACETTYWWSLLRTLHAWSICPWPLMSCPPLWKRHW